MAIAFAWLFGMGLNAAYMIPTGKVRLLNLQTFLITSRDPSYKRDVVKTHCRQNSFGTTYCKGGHLV